MLTAYRWRKYVIKQTISPSPMLTYTLVYQELLRC